MKNNFPLIPALRPCSCPFRWHSFFPAVFRVIVLALFINSSAEAADLPHIGYAFPAGGQPGASVEVKVGGENIYGTASANVTGKGVAVEVVDSKEPVNEKDKDKKQKKKKNQTVIDEIVKLKITVLQDAEPGERELRLITPNGLSNKLVFQVGQLKEINETEPNDWKNKAVSLSQIPVLVNGQIMPGDVDNFKFSAKKGQHLVIETSARALIPYIADAVPGWFQATITLYDSQNNEVAYMDHFRFNPDPVLFYDVPADGDYMLEIRDSIYRGRQDFVYRVKIGELPFITSIFPLGAPHGEKPVSVKISGKNISVNSINIDVNEDEDAPLVRLISVKENGLISNRILFPISNLPEVFENAENNQRDKAMKVVMPVIVNGRIQSPGEKDFFSFEGKKDQCVSIDVQARRLGTPLDSHIILFNNRGEKLAENDDIKDKGEGMITHQADSGLIHKLPDDGIYTVGICDTQGKCGDEYAYRLRVSPPFPDFELRAVPANVSVPEGGAAPLTVHAIRRDGFNGEIKISIKDDPGGLSLNGAVIPEGTDKIRMTVSASENTPANVMIPKLEGIAVIDGENITRPVIPAEDLMQAFIYQHLVPAAEQMVAVTDPPAPFRISTDLPPKGYLELPLGKEIKFQVAVVRGAGFNGPIQLQLVEPPKGITIRKGNIPAGKNTAQITLRTESKTEANLKENLIMTAVMVIEKEENESVAEGAKTKETTDKEKLKESIGTENKDVNKDSKNNKEVKKVRKERIIITVPALPFRIIENPGKK